MANNLNDADWKEEQKQRKMLAEKDWVPEGKRRAKRHKPAAYSLNGTCRSICRPGWISVCRKSRSKKGPSVREKYDKRFEDARREANLIDRAIDAAARRRRVRAPSPGPSPARSSPAPSTPRRSSPPASAAPVVEEEIVVQPRRLFAPRRPAGAPQLNGPAAAAAAAAPPARRVQPPRDRRPPVRYGRGKRMKLMGESEMFGGAWGHLIYPYVAM